MPEYRTYLEIDVDPGGAIPGIGHAPHVRFKIERGGPVVPVSETWGNSTLPPPNGHDHVGSGARWQSYPDDTWIRLAIGPNNWGADDELISKAGSSEAYPLIKYDLARDLAGDYPLYPGAIIYDAKLWFCLKATSGLVGNHAIYFHRVLKPWTEGNENNSLPNPGGPPSAGPGATWLHASWDNGTIDIPWDTPGAKSIGGDRVAAQSGEIIVNVADPLQTWYSVDVTTDLQNMVDVPANNHGWILVTYDTSEVKFYSKEEGFGIWKPYLECSYTQGPPP